MRFKRPVRIEKRDEQTERWVEYMDPVHVNINKNVRNRGYEHLGAGAIRIRRSLVFEVRYSKPIAKIAHNTQMYRIIYEGQAYDIIDYDDYQERHQFVRLTGAFY